MESADVNNLKMFDIVFVDIPKTNEDISEQTGIHPYIIIQNNIGNKYSPTILGISLTSKIKKENMPIHCIVPKTKSNGLKVDSMACAETLRQIDKKRILSKTGSIEDLDTQKKVISIYIANITGIRNDIEYENGILKVV